MKVAIGPPIENGFYYDFEFPEPIREEDLPKIEEEIQRELAEGREWNREEVSAEEARRRFEQEGEPYKVELVGTAEGPISFYTQGDFTDLCRGPHLQDSRPIKAIKLTGLAGAYWRGRREEQAADADLRDGLLLAGGSRRVPRAHRGGEAPRPPPARPAARSLPLRRTSRRARPSGIPKGMVLWNALEDLRRRRTRSASTTRCKTPLIWDIDLWNRSGHWDNYRENIFLIPYGESQYGLKPMNCPGHMLLFDSRLRSYRELPIRYAEAAVLHRDEPTGSLLGLTRARQFTQDDAHVFCTEEHIQQEIDAMFDYLAFLYDAFGVRELAHAELSTRPDHKLGTDEEWDFTEGALRTAIDRMGLRYRVAEGEGAFYGPKIDFHMNDALGRPWQMGTIQLDSQMPKRFGCTYMGADNQEHTPYLIHRALFGSFERFIGILIEHYGGAFPVWLSPVQVRVIPVGEDHREAAHALKEALAGLRVDVDDRNETVGRRIRDAELEKIPYVIVYGDKESEEALAVRKRGGEQSTLSLEALRAEISEVATL